MVWGALGWLGGVGALQTLTHTQTPASHTARNNKTLRREQRKRNTKLQQQAAFTKWIFFRPFLCSRWIYVQALNSIKTIFSYVLHMPRLEYIKRRNMLRNISEKKGFASPDSEKFPQTKRFDLKLASTRFVLHKREKHSQPAASRWYAKVSLKNVSRNRKPYPRSHCKQHLLRFSVSFKENSFPSSAMCSELIFQ